MKSVFLLTGRPGSGKTTIIRKTLSYIKAKPGGFYTEEIRISGIRQGFKIITLDGRESVLSHVDFTGPYTVGKYHVNIQNLETIAVPAILQSLREADLTVIDEIGKMEILSSLFRETVLQAVNSGRKILGTIMLNPNPFADSIKKNPAVNLVTLTAANRDAVLHDLVNALGKL